MSGRRRLDDVRLDAKLGHAGCRRAPKIVKRLRLGEAVTEMMLLRPRREAVRPLAKQVIATDALRDRPDDVHRHVRQRQRMGAAEHLSAFFVWCTSYPNKAPRPLVARRRSFDPN